MLTAAGRYSYTVLSDWSIAVAMDMVLAAGRSRIATVGGCSEWVRCNPFAW